METITTEPEDQEAGGKVRMSMEVQGSIEISLKYGMVKKRGREKIRAEFCEKEGKPIEEKHLYYNEENGVRKMESK